LPNPKEGQNGEFGGKSSFLDDFVAVYLRQHIKPAHNIEKKETLKYPRLRSPNMQNLGVPMALHKWQGSIWRGGQTVATKLQINRRSKSTKIIMSLALVLLLILASSALRGYSSSGGSYAGAQVTGIQSVPVNAFYLGHSSEALSLQTAIQHSSVQFTQSDDPTQLANLGTGTAVYLDKAWYASLAQAEKDSVKSQITGLLERGVPVIEVLPRAGQSSPLITGLLSGAPIPNVGFAANGSSVTPPILGIGVKVFPPDMATNYPTAVGYWASDTSQINK
jgi:hypothetical protein